MNKNINSMINNKYMKKMKLYLKILKIRAIRNNIYMKIFRNIRITAIISIQNYKFSDLIYKKNYYNQHYLRNNLKMPYLKKNLI